MKMDLISIARLNFKMRDNHLIRGQPLAEKHRVDLIPSEKAEIAMRIENSMEGRQGSNQYQQKVDVPILAQAEPGTKTRDIAAKSVDMKPETSRKAKKVVENGNLIGQY